MPIVFAGTAFWPLKFARCRVWTSINCRADLERQIAVTAEADNMGWSLEKLIVPPFTSGDQSRDRRAL